MFEFEAMSKKKRDLYECMWGSLAFDFPVEKTLYRGFTSPNSYTFTETSTENEEICQGRLAELFEITDKDLFKNKFSQSIGGSGQELKRIATVHSSSLCALLFFYNVTQENPYMMEISGEKYCFTYSCFEYQNTVIEGRNPSNMDVVFVGTNNNSGEQVVLFLESKFSEYYERLGKQLEIAVEYLSNKYGQAIYRNACIADMGFYIVEQAGNPNFKLLSEESCYIEGIKQMISHYIGVRNLCDKSEEKNDVIANAISAGAKVLLGEILFTKGIGQLPAGNGEKCFSSYRKRYHILTEAMNGQLEIDGMNDRFTVLDDILSYTQFQNNDCIKEEQIKRFYFGLGKQYV